MARTTPLADGVWLNPDRGDTFAAGLAVPPAIPLAVEELNRQGSASITGFSPQVPRIAGLCSGF
jgi:hypothetical protein